MPQISIIVPVYKVEQYLDRCVNSILNQTFTDFELILVDDGSPDRCPQMCDEWAKKDARIRVIHKENGGLSSARNAGLAVMQGEYVNFVDSDDWIEKDALEYLLYLINKYDADFSFAEMVRVSKEKQNCDKEVKREEYLSQEEFLLRFFKVNTQVNVQYACAKLYKANLFHNIRYYEGITAEDVPTMFEVAILCKRIAHGSKIIYNYFINPNSITQTAFNEKNFDLLTVWDMVCESARVNECEKWIANMAYLNRCRADMGILYQFSIAQHYKKNYEIYKDRINQIAEDLKRELPILLKSQIPLSRKIVAVCLGEAFPLSSRILNILKKRQCKG